MQKQFADKLHDLAQRLATGKSDAASLVFDGRPKSMLLGLLHELVSL